MFGKIKIKKLWDKDINHVLGGGKDWPKDAIRGAVFCIRYKNEWIYLDIFAYPNDTLRLYLPKETKEKIL